MDRNVVTAYRKLFAQNSTAAKSMLLRKIEIGSSDVLTVLYCALLEHGVGVVHGWIEEADAQAEIYASYLAEHEISAWLDEYYKQWAAALEYYALIALSASQ